MNRSGETNRCCRGDVVSNQGIVVAAHILGEISDNRVVCSARRCIQQLAPRFRDAGHIVEEAVREHCIRKGAIVDVEPDIVLPKLMAAVADEDVEADLFVGRGARTRRLLVAVLHRERLAVLPGAASRNHLLRAVGADKFIAAARIPK